MMIPSLDAIQTLAISVKDRNTANQANQFREIRQYIYQYWESIIATLKKCNVLGNEATKLAALAEISNEEEVLALMEKRLSSIKQAGRMASDLITQHDVCFQLYSKYVVQIKPTIGKRKLQSINGYPNGEDAMKSFDHSSKALRGEVVALLIFLDKEIMTYTINLIAADGSHGNLALSEVGSFINKWKRLQPIIMKGTNQIQKCCDSVLIVPVDSMSKKPKPGCIIC